MKTQSSLLRLLLPALCLISGFVFTPEGARAQAATSSSHAVAARIGADSVSGELTPLPGSKHPLAQAQYDTGRVAASTKLQGISIFFSRTQQQEADLQALLVAQQNPASAQYHQWLTPDQFASRFGLADSDIVKVQSWLEQQGFAVTSVARSKNMIRFSGSVGQAEAAFGTEIHNYTIHGEKHFAPSTALSVPSTLAGVVQGVRNLDDFRPKSMMKPSTNRATSNSAKAQFTSGVSGSNFLAPGDITTIYDVKAMYNAGYTGTGETIAIMGQSAIVTSDIEAFQNAASLTVKDPNQLLVPGTGGSEVISGDEGESDLDIEWAGAIAPGAEILFVYTGSSSSNGVFDALQYAVDEELAPILSLSYGACENDLGSSNIATLELITSQAAAQGQTIVAASGDSGSTGCYNSSSTDTLAQQEVLNVNYPASSPYVTGIGGTEFSEGSNTSTYWSSNGTNDVVTSALSYIPEVVWNDDSAQYGISATGGGVSTIFSKPSWQTGVTGIPADGKRDVPDISLDASNDHDSYLYCTSDTSGWSTSQVASCNSGFRDASTSDLTAAGGTSFATPIVAAMVALINQKENYTAGQGLLNPTLYTLAANSSTYASVFHDITSGTNKCTAGSTYCSGTIGYSATTGYDLTTGLGSFDMTALAGAWPASTSTLIGTTTTVSASNSSPTVGTNVTFAIAVGSDSGSTVPTGSVKVTIDDTLETTLTLASGAASYTTTFTTAGAHTIVAAYQGDTTHAASTGTVTVTASAVSSNTGTFTLSATAVTVARGSSANSTITVTPKSGYTGTVDLSFDTSNDSALQNLCYEFTNMASSGDGTVAVTSTSAVTTQLSLDTNASDCATSTDVLKSGKRAVRSLHKVVATKSTNTSKTLPASLALAGLLFAGFLGRYARRFRAIAGVILLAAIGFAVSACGGSSSNTVSNPPTGTYTVTVTGQDSATASISAQTTFTFTIQ